MEGNNEKIEKKNSPKKMKNGKIISELSKN